MSFERRDFAGAAVVTSVVGNITSTATTIPIADASGWPSGTNGKFTVTLDAGIATEEQILVTSRSGTNLLLASSSDRGLNNTPASPHTGGAAAHTSSVLDFDEANFTAANTIGKLTTKGDEIVATGFHAVARLPVGNDGDVRQVDSSQPTGQKWAPISNVSASLAGNGLSGGGGLPFDVNTDGATLEIVADTLRVKALGVGPAQLATTIVDNATLQSTAGVLSVKNGGIGAAQLGRTNWTTYTPTWAASGGGTVLGAGVLVGAYELVGKTYRFRITLTFGTGMNGGTGAWSFSLGGGVTTVASYQTCTAVGIEPAGAGRWPGIGVLSPSSTLVDRIAVNGSTGAAVGVPFTWGIGSVLSITGCVEVV